jgi:hypothetical protein
LAAPHAIPPSIRTSCTWQDGGSSQCLARTRGPTRRGFREQLLNRPPTCGRWPSVRSETLTLKQPPKATQSDCQADPIYSAKRDLHIETQSPEGGVGRKYVNMSSTGSDRSELRTRLVCPLQIRTVPSQVCREDGPSAQLMGSSGLAGLCREQQRLGSNGSGPSALRSCSRDPASGAACLDHTTCAPSPSSRVACAGGTGRTCRLTWGWRAAPHRS